MDGNLKMTAVTPIRNLIINDLTVNPNSTSAEIANRINSSTRSVGSALSWMRGYSIVEDGSTSTEVYDATGTLIGISYSPVSKPIKWSLK
jgi:hypothetical protein